MTTRWEQVSAIYHAALDRDAQERSAFLSEACAGDNALRKEVESLLQYDGVPASILDVPPVPADAAAGVPRVPGSLSGRTIGVYEIRSFIGAGGMGEVYRAHDPRLHRDVAIKISAEQFSGRFQREAEIIAQLNHPHICTLYDVGPDYLVMEYIQGHSLQGPLPLAKALEYCGQICDALDYAHRAGVIHRDLKPSNILVTRHGIKLLDFGIARMSGAHDTLTAAGQAMGTPLFMAPELWRGAQADSRSDIFAMGRVLNAMVTGDPGAERTLDPPALDRVVRTCLSPDPDTRWQTPREVKIALELVQQPAPAPTGQRSTRTWLPWTAAALCLAIAAVVVSMFLRTTPPEGELFRSTMTAPDGAAFAANPPMVSPDGRALVFVASPQGRPRQLWVRALDSIDARPLAGTEGAAYPFWSPDNRSIGFFAGAKLKVVAAAGGPVVTLADAPRGRGGTWSRDGVIVFAPDSSTTLYQIPAIGGVAKPASVFDPVPGGSSHRWPWFLPDGKHFLFATMQRGEFSGVRLGSLESTESRAIADAESSAMYAQGHLLFLKDDALTAQPFDVRRLTTTGGAVPIADEIQRGDQVGSALFSVSDNGLLVYRRAVANSQFAWFDRGGRRMSTLGEPFTAGGTMHFSPDRQRVSVSIADGNNRDIWIFDTARGVRTKATFDPSADFSAVWSPDGNTLVFGSGQKGQVDLYRKPSNLGGTDELLYADSLYKLPTSWSPDGKHLLYVADGDVWVLPAPLGRPGAVKPTPFLRAPHSEINAHFAPSGRWVVHQSNESGRFEIYTTPFPGPGAKHQISTAGGTRPRWNGKEIFYTALDGRLMVARVSDDGAAMNVQPVGAASSPIVVLPEHYYDVSADGQRFLVLMPPESAKSEPFILLQNWTRALKQ